MDGAAKEYWDAIAPAWSDAWPRPPLRPGPAEVRVYRQWASRAVPVRGAGLDALLLGLTRRIAGMEWPAGTRLTAVDASAPMISHVWSRSSAPAGSRALQAEWTRLPLRGESCDLVVSDCMHGVLATRADCDRVHAEARRVLRPAGWFCLRTFLRTDASETVAALFDELRAGEVRNLHLFFWRLAAALQGASPDGVTLHRAWEAWSAQMPDPGEIAALAAECGWLPQEVHLISRWRNSRVVRTAPSWLDLEAYAHGRFDIVDRLCPPGPDGSRFALLAMRAR